jgi:uncharacterized membrane protein
LEGDREPDARRRPSQQSAAPGSGSRAGPQEAKGVDEKLAAALDTVPEPARREIVQAFHEIVEVAMSYQGPLPPPAMLRSYDDVVPGTAERIVAMAEREQQHRHRWEREALSADRWYAMVSLTAGWSVAVALAMAAAAAGIWGDWRVGVALAATSATGMVWKLVQGRSEERDQKAAEPPLPAQPDGAPRGKAKPDGR